VKLAPACVKQEQYDPAHYHIQKIKAQRAGTEIQRMIDLLLFISLFVT
jgi:hypothetical protein